MTFDPSALPGDNPVAPGGASPSSTPGTVHLFDPSGYPGDNPTAPTVVAPSGGRDWDYVIGSPVNNITLSDTLVSSLETVYIHVQVTATDAASGVLQDPTADAVFMAFTSGNNPLTTDWVAAAWMARSVDNTTWIRALVGPNGTVIPTGVVSVFVRIGDTAETVVKLAGIIVVQ